MSLSDYVKLLRAYNAGVTPNEIEEAVGVPAATVTYIERKYRRVGEDDEVLAKLADYFHVPLAELQRRRNSFRKRLTAFLTERAARKTPVRFALHGGAELRGTVTWSDREAIGLDLSDGSGEVIVYRHAVEQWEDA